MGQSLELAWVGHLAQQGQVGLGGLFLCYTTMQLYGLVKTVHLNNT